MNLDPCALLMEATAVRRFVDKEWAHSSVDGRLDEGSRSWLNAVQEAASSSSLFDPGLLRMATTNRVHAG